MLPPIVLLAPLRQCPVFQVFVIVPPLLYYLSRTIQLLALWREHSWYYSTQVRNDVRRLKGQKTDRRIGVQKKNRRMPWTLSPILSSLLYHFDLCIWSRRIVTHACVLDVQVTQLIFLFFTVWTVNVIAYFLCYLLRLCSTIPMESATVIFQQTSV